MKKIMTLIIGVSLLFPSGALVAKERQGAQLVITKTDGTVINGELIAVKQNGILILETSPRIGEDIDISDIKYIKTKKNSKAPIGTIVLSLVGAAAGGSIGYYVGWQTTKGAVIGGGIGLLFGGLFGWGIDSIVKKSETLDIEGRSPEDIRMILDRLRSQARSSEIRSEIPDKDNVERAKDTESVRTGPSDSKHLFSQKAASPKFSRFHLTYRPGYFRSQGGNRYMSLFKEIGFGDTKPAYEIYFFGVYFGTAPAAAYPQLVQNSTKTFEDFRVDYSITRKFAVGVGYSSLGQHEVEGYRYIPINRGGESYYSELYLHENFSGKLYYVQFSWMPVPDAFLKKASFLLGAGAGLSHSNINYRTSKSSYEDNPERKVFSKNAIALMGTAELSYYFNRHWSLGFSAEYRYAPVKVEPFRLNGFYYDLDEFKNLIESTMPVNVPGHTVNSSGFRFGLNAGFHF
jgi:hypothetical protein